jgi:hypothetical protein
MPWGVGRLGFERRTALLRMQERDAIGQQPGDVASLEQPLGHHGQVRAGLDAVSDGRVEDRRDVREAFASDVLPRE